MHNIYLNECVYITYRVFEVHLYQLYANFKIEKFSIKKLMVSRYELSLLNKNQII